MRAILQRVSEAHVTVDGQEVGRIGPGLMVLLGVGHGDNDTDLEWMAQKISTLRIFRDDNDKMNLSVADVHGGVLLVSQFTLYADTRKGKRPSFVEAGPPDLAKDLYLRCGARLRALGLTVAEGVFAADMDVSLVNQGPVTVWLDSRA